MSFANLKVLLNSLRLVLISRLSGVNTLPHEPKYCSIARIFAVFDSSQVFALYYQYYTCSLWASIRVACGATILKGYTVPSVSSTTTRSGRCWGCPFSVAHQGFSRLHALTVSTLLCVDATQCYPGNDRQRAGLPVYSA